MKALKEGDTLTIKMVGEDGADTGETFDAVLGGSGE